MVSVSLVDRSGGKQDAIQKLVAMYQALANRRRLTADILGEFYNGSQDRVYLSISGLGAYGLLKDECGLHQVDRRYKERAVRSGREKIGEDRELLRVETMAASAELPKRFRQDLKAKVVPPETCKATFDSRRHGCDGISSAVPTFSGVLDVGSQGRSTGSRFACSKRSNRVWAGLTG